MTTSRRRRANSTTKFGNVPLVDMTSNEGGVYRWRVNSDSNILTSPGSQNVELMTKGETTAVVSASQAHNQGAVLFRSGDTETKRYGQILCSAAYYASREASS